jgi:hypothetical protein
MREVGESPVPAIVGAQHDAGASSLAKVVRFA